MYPARCLQTSDQRVSATSEILSGIRALRQMGWEDVFERRVRRFRDLELDSQRQRDTVAAYLLSYFSALPPFMIAIVLLVYIWKTPGGFSAAMIFTALSLLNQRLERWAHHLRGRYTGCSRCKCDAYIPIVI